MEAKRSQELQKQIISALEKENCTVKEAKYILVQTIRYIEAFSAVQFKGSVDYEL